jgi:hypothetical protein
MLKSILVDNPGRLYGFVPADRQGV